MPAAGQTTTLHEFAAHSTTVNCLALGSKTKEVRQCRPRVRAGRFERIVGRAIGRSVQ